MFAPLVSSDGEDSPSSDRLNSGRLSVTSSSGYIPMESTTQEEERVKEKKKSSKRSEDENGFELATVRSNSAYDLDDGASASSQSSSLIRSEHFSSSSHPASAASSSNASSASSSSSSSSDSPHHAAATSSSSSSSSATGGGSLLSFELLSLRLKNLMMEDASETAEEELEMTDYDNPEDAILERKFDEDGIGSNVSSSALHHSSSSSVMGGSGSGMHHSIRGGSIGDYAHWVMTCGPCSAITSGVCGFGRRDWRKLRLTFLRMLITIIIGICIGLTGFAVSRTVSAMIHANLHILNDLMGRDRPAAAFFVILIISCIYTGVAALFVTFGSWQTRGSGVGRLNAYLSGMSSSKFLALKTLFVKIGGLVLNVSAGIKQGMEGPFIHIGAMIGLHVSRFILWILNLCFSRWGVTKYTQIVAGVVDERMFISGGAAAGFSVAFNAPIAGVLYVQDGAFAYWQGEYTIRTFLCTMTAVTTINMCWKEGDVLPSRGLIDVGNFLPATITLQEFWGFVILGIIGGCMGIIFTKCNVLLEKFRHKYLAKLRLHNVLDVLACTVLTFLLSFILPFMLGCHRTRYDEWCTKNPDRCLQFQCGPGRYSDLATFFFTLPEETIRILFDRTPTVEAQIPYETLIVFCIFYTLMACISYGMAVPGGLFIPGIISGAAYGRLVGLAVQYLLPSPDPSASAPSGTYLGINPGVYAVLGSASMLGGITRMTLPISVMMIEVTSDAQFLIPIMLVVLIAKVVADFGCGALYAEHLKLDGLVMVFGDRPPPALKQLLAKDVMSSRSVRKLTVISTVADAWAAIKETRHNAFPVTDSSLATLRSILIKNKRAAQAAAAAAQVAGQTNGLTQRRRSGIGSSANGGSGAGIGVGVDDGIDASLVATPPTGVFLGLIQRRHLVYVLTSMPCFQTAMLARDSEPMTALPYELALVGNGATKRRPSESHQDALYNDGKSSSSSSSSSLPSSNGLEVVPLDPSSSSSLASPSIMSPPRSVSHALMHGVGTGLNGGVLMNDEGASASASFVEWIAQQSAGVGQNLSAVAQQGRVDAPPTSTSASASTADERTFAHHSSLPVLPPSASASSLVPARSPMRHHSPALDSSASLLSNSSSSSSSSSSSPSSAAPHGENLALGQDLIVQREMLANYVNLSPFIDQGAYTVSENISAKRVWSMFRSLGMRHIVVLNHQHQPVGVITRRDLIRFAVAQ